LHELIASGQKKNWRGSCCALFESMLCAGPPGQSSCGFSASRGASPGFAFGIGTKKQGEPRLTRFGLRWSSQEQYDEKKEDPGH